MNVVTIAVAAKPPQGSDTKDEIHGNFRESDVSLFLSARENPITWLQGLISC